MSAISIKTRVLLWGRAGHRCSFDGCRRQLVVDATETDDESLIGDAAHIVAESPEGPRGSSEMCLDDRNKYANLILLCKNHHKHVDDQPVTITVETLKAMKQRHEEEVQRALSSLDAAVQRDREVYASYIERWSSLASLSDWNSWTCRLMTSDEPTMRVERSDSLDMLRRWLLGRVWPARYPELEDAFENFRRVLEDLQSLFEKHAELNGEILRTERFYRIREWNKPLYDKLLAEYEYHVWLVEDLTLELTRAANYICDKVRSHVDPSFRLEEGLLLCDSGPHSPRGEFHIHRPQYRSAERTSFPYPGLERFKEVRFERDDFFGERDLPRLGPGKGKRAGKAAKSE